MAEYGLGLRKLYDAGWQRMPLDAPPQEPLIYWTKRIFGPDRDPLDGGSRVISIGNGLLRAIYACAADRSSFVEDEVVVVGPVVAEGKLAGNTFAIETHYRSATVKPDPGCQNCTKYTVNAGANEMMVRGIEHGMPRTISLYPDERFELAVRGLVSAAVLDVAMGDPQYDPTLPDSHEAYGLFSEMAVPHRLGRDLVEAVRQSYAPSH